jgi:hypothetical protein
LSVQHVPTCTDRTLLAAPKSIFIAAALGNKRINFPFIPTVLHVLKWGLSTRVSYETSFDSKQPKLEPKLVSTLSETRRLFRLFRLFRFNIETGCFDVSIELKQTENNRNTPTKVLKLSFLKEKISFMNYV